MSDSRLEKFIYAICSMEVSDLPAPLSRIEILWNCLITGETPDFEPQSRNEIYLMAMLDRYDISNLPAPMSRGEKLLYKIAVGDTDLSDIPAYLSRYEELLKYLIENGGISGGDFEYVLYTLNQSLHTLYLTAEKPVKSAILKGQTLVNLVLSYGFGGNNLLYEYQFMDKPIQSGETFTVFVVNPNISTIKVGLNDSSTDVWKGEQVFDVSINKKVVFTVPSGCINKYVGVVVDNPRDSTGFENGLVITQGDQSHLEVNTYFEGMQSVKMPVLTTTGKNLLDINKLADINNHTATLTTPTYTKAYPLQLKPNTKYSISRETSDKLSVNLCVITIIDGSEIRSNMTGIANKSRIATTGDDGVLYLAVQNVNESNLATVINDVGYLQVEEASVDTSYEPFKSNILSTPEDLELCGFGKVKDELNCLTGEKVERIGEIVLDGSENWDVNNTDGTTTHRFFCDGILPNSAVDNTQGVTQYLCDKLKTTVWSQTCELGISVNGAGVFIYNKSIDYNRASIIEWLKENHLKLQYELAEPIVKTVDLVTVDQDNQPTKLGTFENITHVSLEAENLIPEVEMEVATRISEELASASPLMDDISTEQQQLETMVDEQSDNVNATLVATTEIFEETL